MNRYFIFTLEGFLYPLPLPVLASQDRSSLRWYRVGELVVILGA